jgi:hypothetical protein
MLGINDVIMYAIFSFPGKMFKSCQIKCL